MSLISSCFDHFTETVCVCGADKISLHVIDASLWVHQILTVFTLNLDHSHHNSIDHINRVALVHFITIFCGYSTIVLSAIFVVPVVVDDVQFLVLVVILVEVILGVILLKLLVHHRLRLK